MGKKKRKELKPWCWYCDREFEDEKVLINHQKAKHFKCSFCNKKLNTAGGMRVHLEQVHREDIRLVPNCLPGRGSVDIEIFGMEGVPYDDLERHIREKEAASVVVKKTKFEKDPEAIKAQFAAFQAKKDNPGFVVSTSNSNFEAGTVNKVDQVAPPAVPINPPSLPVGLPMGFPGYKEVNSSMPFIPGMPTMLQIPPVGFPNIPTPIFPPTVHPTQVQSNIDQTQPFPDNVILIYNDNTVSPEEKRAKLARYNH